MFIFYLRNSKKHFIFATAIMQQKQFKTRSIMTRVNQIRITKQQDSFWYRLRDFFTS